MHTPLGKAGGTTWRHLELEPQTPGQLWTRKYKHHPITNHIRKPRGTTLIQGGYDPMHSLCKPSSTGAQWAKIPFPHRFYSAAWSIHPVRSQCPHPWAAQRSPTIKQTPHHKEVQPPRPGLIHPESYCTSQPCNEPNN